MARKIVAIFMLSVTLFNMGGYFMLYRILDARAEAALNERIQAGDITEQEWVEFKIAFELPYPVQERELEMQERVSSGHESYSITSQEYKDNTLTLVGVRDLWAQQVSLVMDAFNKAANGESSDDGVINGLNNLLQAFDIGSLVCVSDSDRWIRALVFPSTCDRLLDFTTPVIPQPPRV